MITFYLLKFGGQGGTRTHTPLQEGDFKSPAPTNYATWPSSINPLNIINTQHHAEVVIYTFDKIRFSLHDFAVINVCILKSEDEV